MGGMRGSEDGNAHGALERECLTANFAIGEEVAFLDLNRLPGEADDSFDVGLGGVIGVVKNGDFETPWGAEVEEWLEDE